jgi:outer membrane lipoprotein-sorting protein
MLKWLPASFAALLLLAAPLVPLAEENADGDAVAVDARGLTRADIDDLSRIDDYLEGLTTLQGAFTQLSDTGGMATGTFYLRMPGRMRFEYDPPTKLRLIADGTWVAVDDMAMKVVNRYPINATPIALVLRREGKLADDPRITSVERLPGQLRVTAREEEGRVQGEITLIFSDPGLELRQWIIEDAQGARTTVMLREVQAGVRIDPALFIIRDYDDF